MRDAATGIGAGYRTACPAARCTRTGLALLLSASGALVAACGAGDPTEPVFEGGPLQLLVLGTGEIFPIAATRYLYQPGR